MRRSYCNTDCNSFCSLRKCNEFNLFKIMFDHITQMLDTVFNCKEVSYATW